MARILLFPDESDFNYAVPKLEAALEDIEVLAPPAFCEGLVSPCVLIPHWKKTDSDLLQLQEIQYVGNIDHKEFGREIPAVGPPDPRVFAALGWMRLKYAGASVSDPHRYRFEFTCAKDLRALIPVMARLISGGAFSPDTPALAIEEGHRLIVVNGRRITISRVDDLLDMWIMVRTTVDFITLANERYQELKPETKPRRGLGASEIYKRLPATDCGQCGKEGCMDFATELLMGRVSLDDCAPLNSEEMARNRESLEWIAGLLGTSE